MALGMQRLSLAILRRPGWRSCSSTPTEGLYDLVIASGGTVGAALACSIGREPSLSHKKVLLLESAPFAPRPVIYVMQEEQYSNRISVLSLGSVELLKRINAWSLIEEARAKAYTRMHVWDACSDARVIFNQQKPHNLNPAGQSPAPEQEVTSDDIIGSSYHDNKEASTTLDDVMGYVVENRVVMSSLVRVLERECGGVEVKRGMRLREVNRHEGEAAANPWVELVLEGGKTIKTKLLVGADGSNSRVRQLCEFQQVGWKYDQSVVVATLDIHEVPNNTIWQRFLPSGPITMLPLSSTVGSLVWSTSPSHAQSLLEMSEESFVDAVNVAFWDPLPQDDLVAAVNDALKDTLTMLSTGPPPPRQLPPTVSGIGDGSRASFPLALGHSPYYVKPRVALVGDAAHTVHPLAGLGVNLGLGDVAVLTSCLLKANSSGADWGALSHLQEYETTRQWYNVPTMAAIDGIKHLFSTSWTPAVLLRSLGFHITNALPPLKEFVMDHAQRAA